MEEKELKAAYDAGVLDQRLTHFDQHFKIINGSIAETATELKRISTLMQELLGKVLMRDDPLIAQVHQNTHRLGQIEDREKTLAEEIERRRLELVDERANQTDSFIKRHSTTGLSLSTVTILLGALYFILSHVQ